MSSIHVRGVPIDITVGVVANLAERPASASSLVLGALMVLARGGTIVQEAFWIQAVKSVVSMHHPRDVLTGI